VVERKEVVRMAEIKTKEGELTDADLAAYGIPPKQPEGLEEQIVEQAKEKANDSEAEVPDEVVEKAGNA
jgi:hypothetical protein